jgi:hypothetical protein
MSYLTLVQPDASLAQRLRAFVWRVVIAVGERVNRAPEGSLVRHRVPLPVYRRIADWMQARRQAIEALMARIAAGTLRTSAAYAPRTTAVRAEPKPRTLVPDEERFPRLFGWMCRWAPEGWLGAADLRGLLDDPAMQAVVLAAPARMVRLWSPLLFAVGQIKPDWFPKPPTRERRARPGRQRPQTQAAPSLLMPPPAVPPPAPLLPTPKPIAPAAPWTGRGPGPCASLAQYRSPYECPAGEHPRLPPAPDEMPAWKKRLIQRSRRDWV